MPLRGFRAWLRGRRVADAELERHLQAAQQGPRALRFVDRAGDAVAFEVTKALELSVNGGAKRHVARVQLEAQEMLVKLGDEELPLQIDLPEHMDRLELEALCARGGLLPSRMREPMLSLAFQYLFWPGEGRASNPDAPQNAPRHTFRAFATRSTSISWPARTFCRSIGVPMSLPMAWPTRLASSPPSATRTAKEVSVGQSRSQGSVGGASQKVS